MSVMANSVRYRRWMINSSGNQECVNDTLLGQVESILKQQSTILLKVETLSSANPSYAQTTIIC